MSLGPQFRHPQQPRRFATQPIRRAGSRAAMAGLVAVSLALSSCSADGETLAASNSSASDGGQLRDKQLQSTTDSETDLESSGDSTATGSESSSSDAGSPPTTAGSGLPPVTTVPGPEGGDPQGIYQGVLGALSSTDLVAESVVAPPPARTGIAPLTGLESPALDRPAAVVKIDNGAAASPQTGLNAADIVIEEEVEGGVTRFAAIFHSTPSIVGPVRSGRTSDVALISSLGEPLYLYSGANDITEMIIRRQASIRNRRYSSSSGYWRDSDRQAPSNVYTDTAPHWASAEGGAPPPQFEYRDQSEEVAGEAVTEFAIDYSASPVRWVWQGKDWVRHQRGKRHDVASGQAVTAANVVVVEVDRVATGMVDSAGGQVPESVFVGTGPVTVFTDGKRVEGQWTRPTLASVATLTTGDGQVLKLTPGRTWIQLIEAGTGALT